MIAPVLTAPPQKAAMYKTREALYGDLETARSSRVITYVTGDRRGLETQIHSEVLDPLVEHLDRLGGVHKLSLVLYTRGGDTLAAWSIVNLLRQFCEELEVVVPAKCHSAGTLICLGADRIVMTKQATLGPIDPSVNGPLNPPIPGAPPNARAAVSVEAIKSYLTFAQEELHIRDGNGLATVLVDLARHVHPLVLGDVLRASDQIRMLGRRLISRQVSDESKIQRILDFLCSESGSHDYTIYRREAREELGLTIEKPSEDLYKLIKALYDDLASELELGRPLDPLVVLGAANQAPYRFVRALVESGGGGSHRFVSEGQFVRQRVEVQQGLFQDAIEDQRRFEGWKHEA